MSRRSTPERIYQAHRAGTLERIVSAGVPRDGTDAGSQPWEDRRTAEGIRRDRLDWDVAFREIADLA